MNSLMSAIATLLLVFAGSTTPGMANAGVNTEANAEVNTGAKCGGITPCKIKERSYQAVTPDGWNGKDRLPVLIHFHGWGRTGTNVINNRKIAGAANETGVLLLAPNGLGKSWSFWRAPSRDVPFVEAMIEDAAGRFPIDREQIYVSGFSYGAAMAWRLACERGADYAAFLPIAGTLWNFEELEDCSSPVTIRHVHGLRDTVMDLPVGRGGDPLFAVSPWLARNGCKEKPDSVSTKDIFNQNIWTNCSSGHDVELELHNFGHIIPKGWMKRQLERLRYEKTASAT